MSRFATSTPSSNLVPATKNNNSKTLARGIALDQGRTQTRNVHQQILDVPKRKPSDVFPTGQEWAIESASIEEKNDIRKNLSGVRRDLNQRYPWTYNIPEEKKFNVIRRYTDSQGRALLLDGQTDIGAGNNNPVLGQAYVGPEYFEFIQKEMEREEAMAFKAFCFNNMDISTPLKKEYWKKKSPELFQELIDALKMKQLLAFRKALICLEGPKGEDDFEFVYQNFVKPNLYTENIEQNKEYPPNAPTTLPFPQGAIDYPESYDPNFRRNWNEFNQLRIE